MDPTDEEFPEFTASDADDQAILMHRDAHFAGSFELMIDYYREGGKGVNPAFELARIEELAALERASGNNLASMLLEGPDAERIQRSKKLYKGLRELYEIEKPKSIQPRLIADLILSEEEEPKAEIAAIVSEGATIVPLLIELLRSEDFSDSLAPGYGSAPMLAAHCLGEIGDKRAIISLFEAIGEGDFFNEDATLHALKSIGTPAKEFLLRVLHGKPYNFDNERAAIALVAFNDDPEVAKIAFEILASEDTWKDLPLTMHLILLSAGLKEQAACAKFTALKDNPRFPPLLKRDLQIVADDWSKADSEL